MDIFLKFLSGYGSIVVVVVLLLIIFAIKFNGKVRAMAYKYIPEAEDGSIKDTLKNGAYETLDKIQRSDLDERMVQVMAVVIQQIPLLRILPTSAIEGYVNKLVQTAFDNIKAALKVEPKTKDSDTIKFVDKSAKAVSEETIKLSQEIFNKLEKQVQDLTKQTKPEDTAKDAKALLDLINSINKK